MFKYKAAMAALVLVLPFFQQKASGQEAKNNEFFGKVITVGEDGKMTPVSGASISISSGDVSLNSLSDWTGAYRFSNVKAGTYSLKVSHASYREYETSGIKMPEVNNLSIILEKEEIQAAVVKASAKLFEFRLDTLVYNIAATQRVSDEEMLGEVMAKMPGVTYEDGVLKVMGEPVHKVYINNKLIFGDAPSDALSYLAGNEVISVKVYDQETSENRALGRKGRKERVMDVKTRSDIDHALVAQASLSGGRNLETQNDGTDWRYHAGAGANYFSEMNLASINVYTGNIGRKDNVLTSVTDISRAINNYDRLGYAGASFVKKIKDPEMGTVLKGSYSYRDQAVLSSNSTERQYLENGNLTDWYYFSESQRNSENKKHSINMSLKSFLPYIPMVEASLTFASDSSFSRTASSDIDADKEYTITSTIGNRRKNWDGQLSMSKGFSTPIGYLNIDLKGNIGEHRGEGLQKDETQTSTHSYITSPLGQSSGATAEFRFGRQVNETYSANITYSLSHKRGSQESLRFIDSRNEANLDSLTSEIRSNNSLHHRLNLRFDRVDGHGLTGGILADLESQNALFRIPYEDKVSKQFVHIAPQLTYRIGSMIKSASFNYYSTQNIPSIEQLSAVVNTADPMHITCGNPDLKQSRRHVLTATGSIMKSNGLTFTAKAEGQVSTGEILQRIRQYRDEGALGSTELVPGATVLSWENASRPSYSAQGNADIRYPVRSIRTTFGVNGRYEFTQTPSFINDISTTSISHRPSLSLSSNTSFSSKYKLSVTNSTAMVFSNNDVYGRVSWMDETVKVKSNNRIAPWLFINADYSFRSRIPIEGNGARIRSNTLNMIAGSNLKVPGLELSLACYDILNSRRSFTTIQRFNYIQSSFTPIYGRIWTLNLTYRFNSTQKKNKSKINFGHEAPQIGTDYENSSYKVKY